MAPSDWYRKLRDKVRQRHADARVLVIGGEEWMVYEVDDVYGRSATTLVFESIEVIRRVRHFPVAWRELSEPELYAVSWRR